MLLRCLIAALILSIYFGQVVAEPDRDRVRQADWAAKLGNYLAILDKNPSDHDAIKGAWLCAMRLGLYTEAGAFKSALSQQEIDAMDGDQAALAIRYGRIDARTLTGPDRYRSLDEALSRTDALAQNFLNGQQIDSEQQRRLIDRLTALVARQRPFLAIDLYERLRTLHIAIPSWAERDVADAYLMIRQPRTAEQLYRAFILVTPDDFDANIGLFYALVESEQLDLAQKQIDQFTARLPRRRHLDGQANGERTSAELLSDLQRVYANRLLEARQRIEAQLNITPFNQEARSVQSAVDLALGWQRRAEMETRINIVNDPDNAGLRAGHAELLLAMQRWDQAQAELEVARQLDSEQPRVVQAEDSMTLWRRAELDVDAGFGRGENKDPFGSSDYHVDTWLYSSPINTAIRVFLHNTTASADFYGTNTDWIRTGAGLEWRSGDWKSTAEINAGEFAKAGLLTTLQWQANDAWKLYGNVDSVTNDIPLQAVDAKITAWQANVGVDYQVYDGRKLALAIGSNNFSDGNRRHSVIGSWFERWIDGPGWTFDTTFGADASRNSLGYAAAYFNPPTDHSLWLTGAIDNLAWRNYDWSLRQRLAVTVGEFWQTDFDRGATQAIEYQHRWELGRSASLNYSIGHSLRPYDGVREARNYGAFSLLWRF